MSEEPGAHRSTRHWRFQSRSSAGSQGSSFARFAAVEEGFRWSWYWLSYEQKRPVNPRNWVRYDSAIEWRLSSAYSAFVREGRTSGRVLDIGAFSDHKAEVWLAEPVIARNPLVG